MLHVHFPGHGDTPKKRFKRGTVNPPRVILDSPTTPPPLASPPVKKKPSLLLHNKRDLRPSKPQDEKPSVAVAVPTHNRIGYVQLTSKALRGTVPANDVWVFDDQSDEYKHKDLAAWYGTEHIFIAKRRLKADAMARHILEWFVSSQYDVLVLLDSDLVVAPNWLDSLHDGLRESKGLLSLYRSGAPKHKSLRCGGVLCEQPSMGNAGTVWRRSITEKMLSEMSNREGGFDWGWSEWCTKNRVPMQALKASAVLHIGMHGSWSHETTQEKSVGFPMNELTEDIRKQAEHFLKGAKPLGQIETWQSFENVWLPRYYQMAYANPEARTPNDLEKVKQTCIKLGCVAVSVEQNGWLAYFRNIPLDKSKWLPKRHATMWVMSKYLVSTTKQPDMKYGCSRHAHACRRDPEQGSAPCCAHVMLEIMSDMSRVLRKHNIHWRLTQGQQLSVARDGFVQLWDHDFDPNFDQPEKAKAVIEQEMHLAGKASKYREADYYYTKRVAERLNTDWSKYKVMGGDFDWNVKEFHDPHALQRNPTFMDIGQNHDAKPTAETTFPCLPGHDILCSKRWFEEVVAEFHSGYQRPSSGMPQEQIPYSGYVAGMNNLMFDENGHERDAQSRADTIRKYISACPNFWERPCLTSTKPPKSDILWVIPAFKRAWSLDLVLKSLTGKKILVSKDADSAEIDSVLKKYTADVISHPWSCSKHPNRFPAKDDTLNENYKGDTYGNPRSSWATCLKHHWWWMMKQAWARKPERVCVLEDDTVIHPQAFQWLVSQSGNVKLTPDEIAVPWCMSAKEWQAIDPKTFCEHDDYNWDQTIAWMKEHGHGPNEASVPSVSLSMHVGDCGGWDAGGRDKKCTSEQIVKIRANVEDWLGKPVAVNTIKKKWLTAHSKPNGGWGHPKDWAHCLGKDLSSTHCDNIFKSQIHGKCVKTYLSDICLMPKCLIDTSKISGSMGGEPLNSFQHIQSENEEKLTYSPGTLVCEKKIDNTYTNVHIKRFINTVQIHNGLFDTNDYLTLFIQRGDYANPCMTMATLFNVWQTLHHLSPEKFKIIWLDGHPSGSLDSIWKDLFNVEPIHVQQMKDGPIHPSIVVNVVSAFGDEGLNAYFKSPDTCTQTSDLLAFRNAVLRKYNIKKTTKKQVTLLLRKDYTAHLRSNGITDRKIADSEEAIDFLQMAFPNHHVIKVFFEDMSFRKQLEIIYSTDVFISVHGAGNIHVIFLPENAVFYELFPPGFASRNRFHFLSKAMGIQYNKIMVPVRSRQNGKVTVEITNTLMKTFPKSETKKEKHSLCIIIPFRDHANDINSQGSNRENNLKEWLQYMSRFLSLETNIYVVEQSKEGIFNKGWLFNIGYNESNGHCDYLVLHDVDQIPLDKENDYLFRETPTKLIYETTRNNHIRKLSRYNVGGALMITRQKYQEINGYSNKFGGWGREDDNMALRLQKHGGYDSLPPKIGRYKELKHPRVMGLDDNEQFKKNVANTHDFVSGLSDLKYEIISSEIKTYGLLRVKRIKVQHTKTDYRIIQAFPINHELHMLEFRLRETCDVTDFFVIHEAFFDSFHNPKPKYAYEKKDYFETLCPGKLIWTEQRNKASDNGWAQDAMARNSILPALKKQLKLYGEDIIILTDADEIPNKNTIERAREGPYPMQLWLYPYKFALFWRNGEGFKKISSIDKLKNIDKLYDLRGLKKPITIIKDAGWHFSWIGTPEYIIQKAKQAQASDGRIADDSTKMTTSYIREMVCNGHDWNGETHWGSEKRFITNSEWPSFFDKFDFMVNKSWWCQKQFLIKTSDLFAAIDYNAPENKGPWKQGWDYDYDGRFKDGLTVHVVPHSHNDPGWIKTYHTYYSTQTRHILDTVVAALTEDPRRTFIWAEISYFSLWWNDATQQQKEQAKKLVAEKRLDFVTGGWVMNDEASVTARATRWHLQEGREWLQNTFGITPQYSWAIDPFGHSAGQAHVLKELGYKGMLIQRVHYAVKKQLAEKQQLEFQWQTPAGEIFTHMMPFYSYDGPHTCGPDPSVCCQFDFARIGGYGGCPWHKPSVSITDDNVASVSITDDNVAERSRTWLDQVYKKAMLYRGKHVLVPVGDDFRYQTMDEAHKQFTNYQKMFDWIKVNVPSVSISFSTLSRYFDAVVQTQVPKLQGSFFPYSDRAQDYWTGYFNSRIFYKGYDRLLESLIATAETKCPTVDIHLQKRALGLFQHHDGITGTAKSDVVQDYYKTMQNAVIELKSKLKTCLDIAAHVIVNPLSVETPTMKANEIRPYQEDTCEPVTDLQFDDIKLDEHGRLLQINDTPVHESLVWRSNTPGPGKAGAYLMSVTSKEDVLQAKSWTTCVAKKYKQVETVFDMLKRRIRVYNDGTIEFIYAVDIHARNNGELWAVYKPEWSAERLCSDVHGLTWECHVERKDAPLQAKFWPMPTMAWLASSSERLTFTGAQPTGVGFHEGAMVLMLDRRGDQDDARGLGQGITDSRPVEMRFVVLMETEDVKEQASKEALSRRNWMLNPEIRLV